MKKALAVVAVAAVLTGCASMTHQQKADYVRWKSEGKLVQEKSEGTAFGLGFLPGGGSFYTRQYGLGVLDLLLWPFSVLWDPAVGVGGAQKINFEATMYNKQRDSSALR